MPSSHLHFDLEHDLWWTANAVLPSWNGFQTRHGAYGSQSSAEPSDGSVRIVFAPEGRGTEPLTDAEVASVAWLVENEASVSLALLSALLAEYPSLQDQYGYSAEEAGQYMPKVASVEDFRGLIGLHSVNVHPLQKDGMPYVGFELGCTWDDEHGLGALMHGTRVVEIGGADAALLLWIAKRDAAKP
ncbi:DUF6985 domain-containing protein [Caenimonas terrae]|uniref:DUF6985 domain-containing protein n=1 Tax=Caenimonas terrae TaxID=696074 RepID=A0ABW0NIH9_9BURK